MKKAKGWNKVENNIYEYVEKIISKSYLIENEFGLEVNDDGMITLSENIDIRKHGIMVKEQLIFPHVFYEGMEIIILLILI